MMHMMAHLGAVCSEGGCAGDELVQDAAQRPPVHRRAVADAQQQLRGQVVRRAHRTGLLRTLLARPAGGRRGHACVRQAERVRV